MKRKKELIIGIIVIVILTLISIIIISAIRTSKENKNDTKVIESSYALLTENIKEYNEIRTKYTGMLGDLFLEDYQDKHDDFVDLLTEYNKNMQRIDLSITNINLKCNRLYKNSNVNKICKSYKEVYEKVVNLYVSDLNNYNSTVKKYNEYKNEKVSLFEMIHDEYIDYNKDGNYEGREEDEENQDEQQ